MNICANICMTAGRHNCLGRSKMHSSIWSVGPEAGAVQRESRQEACPERLGTARLGMSLTCHQEDRTALLR